MILTSPDLLDAMQMMKTAGLSLGGNLSLSIIYLHIWSEFGGN